MTHQKRIYLFITLLFIGFACNNLEDENLQPEDPTLRRMPFNQRVFLLNSKNVSEIFEINYDFQGLTGDATLTKLPLTRNGEDFDLPRGGHMTVDPTKSYIIVSITRDNAVWAVNLTPNADDKHEVKRLPFATSPGGITQVDFDEDDYLFLAGRGGFYRVSSPDVDNRVWELEDGETVEVSEFSFNNDIELGDEGEDGEDYFDDLEETDSQYRFINKMQARIDRGKFRFAGGDITFTQNSDETAGFEEERLITFTQWGNMAAHVSLAFTNDGLSYNAKALFRVRKVTKENGSGTHKVTGGALMGDNLLITSHHFTDNFSVWNLSGEELARPQIKFADPAESFGLHNWGDMATTQVFDGNIDDEDRMIGEEDPYYPFFDGAQMAEVKLYRPGAKVTGNYDVSDDNPGVNLEARRNSSNSDIADVRRKAYKFTSLGGGYMVLKFPNRVVTSESTKLQVTETSWNKEAAYEDTDAAYRAYPEQASVYVSTYEGKYYGEWANDESNWTKVGDAFISSNLFDVSGISEFSWVKIVDDNSRTPDGFDVNWVSIFEGEEDTPDEEPLCSNNTFYLPSGNSSPFARDIEALSLGAYVEGDQSTSDTSLPTGYRWVIRNNGGEFTTVRWDIQGTSTSGTFVLDANTEVHFSTERSGTLRVFQGLGVAASAVTASDVKNIIPCGGEGTTNFGGGSGDAD
ncbi:MAG: hypothetical protein WBA74_12035 [Cyclobacteriaceae bacterium]